LRLSCDIDVKNNLQTKISPPAPEIGAQRVHNDVSPVLAQTFTEQFTVFSAKRFPGVPGNFDYYSSTWG